ncbi:MAG: glycosyltransferase family 39 protein [Anaerolineales bacterium]|nr:glycosyltransferase family 39 protein [Anaerolineales bacterium]
MMPSDTNSSLFNRSLAWHIVILVVLFVVAIGIRVYDLTDAPLDFHPTRQVFTAIVARGMYYENLDTVPDWQRERAVGQWQAEQTEFPSIDGLAVLTYRLIGQEDLFYPRLYSVLFWVLGGLAVYFLGRELVSPDGAVIALAFYLFAPYAVVSSRSFQPDPMMMGFILFAWWAMWRWFRTGKWGWAIAAGLLGGLAILFKSLAAFSLLGGLAGVFFARDLRKSLRSIQFWVMGLLTAVPILIWMYYGFFVEGSMSDQFSLRFFPNLWFDPIFYLGAEAKIERVVGLLPLVLGLLGPLYLAGKEKRVWMAGLWGGYVLFGVVFAYYFMTHDYYHLSLVPIVALGLAPVGDLLLRRLVEMGPGRLARFFTILVLLAGFSINLWNLRQTFHRVDYRPQVQFWAQLGEAVDYDSRGVSLTQDYGYPLFYWGWIIPSYWPHEGDIALREMAGMSMPEFFARFNEMTADRSYFLVTDLDEFENQPQLQELLYTTYPVLEEGEGYVIFDLRHPLSQP